MSEKTVVRIRGMTYPSMTAAARAIGVPIPTIAQALDRGTLETCGLDHFGGLSDGQYFPSKAAAARARNMTEHAYRHAIKTGKVVWTSTTNQPRRATMLSNEATPIRVRGVTYPSIRAAARGLSMSPSAIIRALEKGTLDDCGLDRYGGHVDGVWYPSKAAAARAYGVNKFTFIKRIQKGQVQWVA